MILSPDHPLICYTGRWHISASEAVSTANGSYAEFSFSGECAVLEFGIDHCTIPFPRIYLSVDNGANIEVPLDKFIRISAESTNPLSDDKASHTVRLILKGSVELQNRWLTPLEAAVSLRSIEADDFLPLSDDCRKTIEFLGDSITEGISIDVENRFVHYGGSRDMVFWDDATAGYAWQTAKLLNMRPLLMGYGCLGTTQGGAGNLPDAVEAYPYSSDGCPIDPANADYIVINHGTNDRRASREAFFRQYRRLLDVVRERNPHSKIIALTPFCGAWADEIRDIVETLNRETGDDVYYINTTGWIPPEPLHPTRDGHKTVARKLAELLKPLL